MNILELIKSDFRTALSSITENVETYADLVRPSQDKKFGDYQANCAMPLKKELGGNPREIAQKIINQLPNQDRYESIEIAGPGFINLTLKQSFLEDSISSLQSDERLGIEPIAEKKTMIVDFSSPNVAKPMHVGHLRSTVIGDAIVKIYRTLGWNVLGDNHLGDWGTQFGMLIYGWKNLKDEKQAAENPLAELARLYKAVNHSGEQDEDVAKQCRLETAKLHQGDEENLALWNTFMPWCMEDLNRIYKRLDIQFDLYNGESHYHPLMESTVDKLQKQEVATESDGAICVFFHDENGKTDDEGNSVYRMPPAIIRKSDGGFTYSTSDVACVLYRMEKYNPDAMIYVVDDRQSLHFQQVFEISSSFLKDAEVLLQHVPFGKITGKDKKPYKTREGKAFGLETLLDEGIARAKQFVDENSAHLPEEERAEVAEKVGIGAIKYYDLSQNRTSDYVFDLDRMISLSGNTAPYLQYAFARNKSIFRKGDVDFDTYICEKIILEHPAERDLAIVCCRLPEVLNHAAKEFKPNLLAEYLFSLAGVYSTFHHDCRVLDVDNKELKSSRLALCKITALILQKGLEILGIETAERL